MKVFPKVLALSVLCTSVFANPLQNHTLISHNEWAKGDLTFKVEDVKNITSTIKKNVRGDTLPNPTSFELSVPDVRTKVESKYAFMPTSRVQIVNFSNELKTYHIATSLCLMKTAECGFSDDVYQLEPGASIEFAKSYLFAKSFSAPTVDRLMLMMQVNEDNQPSKLAVSALGLVVVSK